MIVRETALPGVLLIEPEVHADERGHFLETWQTQRYAQAGLPEHFCQDSLSSSGHGVLRGLHFQYPREQGKLVYVLGGEVWDVAVDVRVGSPTFGRWEGHVLSASNHRQIWIPPGFAHGFLVTGEGALFAYKCSDCYDPAGQVSIRWNDPDIGIEWPAIEPRLSPRDAEAPTLASVDPARLPKFGNG